MTSPRGTSVFAGFRFPPEVISVAVRRYPRHGLSCQDVEELLTEHGTTVDHITARHWAPRQPVGKRNPGRAKRTPKRRQVKRQAL